MLAREAPTGGFWSIPPSPEIARQVVCLWAQTFASADSNYLNYPDACSRIIFTPGKESYLIGPTTEPIISPVAHKLLFGVRLRPGTASALLNMNAEATLDRTVAIKSDAVCSSSVNLFDNLDDTSNIELRLEILERRLAQKLRGAQSDVVLENVAIRLISQSNNVRVGELSTQLGCSSRHMQRRFKAVFGYTPKRFVKIIRFQRLLSVASQRITDKQSLADMAIAAGYADQSHMNREVVLLTGETPRKVLGAVRSTLFVSDSFKKWISEATTNR